MTMTFFGQEGTKNGATRVARLAFFATFLFSISNAFAGTSSNTNWAETTTLPPTFAAAAYGFDAGANTPPTIPTPNPQGQNPVLLSPGQVSYSIISQPIYRVRQDLSLEMSLWYSFIIVPSTESIGTYVNLKEGDFYKIRAVVVRPAGEYLHEPNHYPNVEERYLTSQKMLGRYVNGAIRISMPLTFPDIQWAWVRSNLYFSITPIDQSQIKLVNGKIDVYSSKILVDKKSEITDQLTPVSLPIYFTPLKSSDTRQTANPNVTPDAEKAPVAEPEVANDLDGYIARAEAKRGSIDEGNSRNVTPEQYKTLAHLQLIDINSNDLDQSLNWMRNQLPPVEKSLNRQELLNTLQLTNSYSQPMPDQMDRTAARALCVQLMQLQGLSQSDQMSRGLVWVNGCTYYPYYYLSFHKNIHVTSLNTMKTSGTDDIKRPFQVISNLAFNKSRSTDMSASLGFSPTGLLPNSYGGSFGFSVGEGISVSIAQSGVAQSFMAVNMQPIITHLPLSRYTTCMAVEIDSSKFLNRPIKVRGLYFCDSEKYNLSFSERFYFTWQDTSSQENASQQAFHSLFRGDRDANSFLSLVNDATTVLSDNAAKNSPMIVGDIFANAGTSYRDAYARGMPGQIPGIISLPMVPTKTLQSIQTPASLKKPRWYQQLYSLVSHDSN